MSGFFSSRHSALRAYTPGEQPQDMQYIKLNTNESPLTVSERVKNARQRRTEDWHILRIRRVIRRRLMQRPTDFYRFLSHLRSLILQI